MPPKQEPFGTLLRRVRSAAGHSQTSLAEQAGLHRTFVAELEANRQQPSLATVKQLVAVLGKPFTKELIQFLES